MILTDEEFFALPPAQGQKAVPPATQEGQPPIASDQAAPPKGIMSEEEFMGQLTPESQKKVREFAESNARGKAALRGAAQGFTLGYEPELLGGQLYQQFANPNPAWAFGLGSPPDLSNVPKQAQEITEAERKANEKAQAEHPLPFFAGNVAGSALNPVLNAVKPSVTSGAVIGGISGASEGKTPTERLKGAAEGAVSGGVLSGMLKNIGHPDQAEIDRIVREAKELGIDVPRYMANPNLFMQSTANIMKNLPVAGGPIEKSARKVVQQMGTAADNLGGVDPEFAGRIFGDNIKNWVTKTSKETVGQAYEKVSGLMDPKILTPLENTGDLIAKLAADNVEAAKEGASGAIKMVLPAVQR
ncbi:MAG: hypothetical protein EBY21_12880, partial [Alphaproteobacteria bacterium]|nr:hypothetical protein [Alphaproteobacteria bacterium]